MSRLRHARPACLVAGLAVLAIAILPPLHGLAEALLTAHMVQHLLLVLVAAPLLAVGRPLAAGLRTLPGPARRLAVTGLRRAALGGATRRTLGHPVAVWIFHVAVLWAWHAPRLYDLALRHEAAHAAEHATLLATAVAFWATAIRGGTGRLGFGGGVLFLFAAAMQSTILGALLALAERPWYTAHLGTAPRWRLSPLEDQQLAGAIMWVPAGAVYLAALLALVGRSLAAGRGAERLLLVMLLLASGSCADAPVPWEHHVEGGDPERGAAAISRRGCGACHIIPGIPGARGVVGPSLDRFARRPYIAGQLVNESGNLMAWLHDPPAIEPGTVMPKLGLTEQEVRDIAALLYTLR